MNAGPYGIRPSMQGGRGSSLGGPQGAPSWSKKAAPARRRSRVTDVAVSVVLPWLVFFLVISIFLFAYHEMKVVVWVLVGMCSCLALLFLVLGAMVRNATFLAIGFLCLTSVLVGTAVGVWMNNEYLNRYWALDAGAEYKDVDPTAPVSKTKDASILHFLPDTFVDDRRTVGYVSEGGIFCVAPVSAEGLPLPLAQYWAVGEDCCQTRSNFDCGTSRASGTALSGITEESTATYRQAIREAQSVYQMNTTDRYLLVSFVSNPKQAISDIWDETLTIALVAMIMDLCICGLAGLVIAQVLMPPNPERMPLVRKP